MASGVDYFIKKHLIYFLQADKINPITKAGGQKLVVLDDRQDVVQKI